MDLVPIKIKICRKSVNGRMTNDYPDFNQIELDIRDNLDWSYYIDQFGGWCYDKKSGFGFADPEDANDPHNNTDHSCQYGCVLVKKAFAQEAIKKFPSRVTELNETDWESFYDKRANINSPEEKINPNIINGITAKKNAGITLNQSDIDALDPEKDTPGIVKNKHKRWATLKAMKNISIISIS